MKTIEITLEFAYSIHADVWTETLEGILYIIEIISELERSGERVKSLYLARTVMISSCYLAEQVFSATVERYLGSLEDAAKDQGYCGRLLEEWKKRNKLRNKGFSAALKAWPKILTGKPLVLGEGILHSFKELLDERNEAVHTLIENRRITSAGEIARSALSTAIQAAEAIEQHFFPGQPFSYRGWIRSSCMPKGKLFKRVKT